MALPRFVAELYSCWNPSVSPDQRTAGFPAACTIGMLLSWVWVNVGSDKYELPVAFRILQQALWICECGLANLHQLRRKSVGICGSSLIWAWVSVFNFGFVPFHPWWLFCLFHFLHRYLLHYLRSIQFHLSWMKMEVHFRGFSGYSGVFFVFLEWSR